MWEAGAGCGVWLDALIACICITPSACSTLVYVVVSAAAGGLGAEGASLAPGSVADSNTHRCVLAFQVFATVQIAGGTRSSMSMHCGLSWLNLRSYWLAGHVLFVTCLAMRVCWCCEEMPRPYQSLAL